MYWLRVKHSKYSLFDKPYAQDYFQNFKDFCVKELNLIISQCVKSAQMRENTDQKKTPDSDTFHVVLKKASEIHTDVCQSLFLLKRVSNTGSDGPNWFWDLFDKNTNEK